MQQHHRLSSPQLRQRIEPALQGVSNERGRVQRLQIGRR
jgi:hypothetical protein